MASETEAVNKSQDDLIDFRVSSTVTLPQEISTTSDQSISDNLLDTELPVLEQKLQTAAFVVKSPRNSLKRKQSIDLEDILITIDDGDDEASHLGNTIFLECDNNQFPSNIINPKLDNFKTNNNLELLSISSWDNDSNIDNFTCDFIGVCNQISDNVTNAPNESEIEALLVLKNLDDLLNETLRQSQENIHNEEEEKTQKVIEDCLLDLDNYLQALENIDENDSCSVSNSSCQTQNKDTSRESINLSDFTGSVESFEHYSDESYEDFNDEIARHELRQIEKNYRKFFAYGCVNEGYLDTEAIPKIPELRRSLSANIVRAEPVTRTQPSRATVSVIRKKARPRLLVNRRKSLEYDQNNSNDIAQGCDRISAIPDGDTHEEIRLHGALARDVSIERQAHASAESCTATVIVEPIRHLNEPQELPKISEDETRTSVWRRSSMRRIEQLQIPTVEHPQSNTVLNLAPQSTTNIRPISAPSRLSVSRTSSRRSRSRSRDSRVSLEPNGRARSSSASSRSRRPRSLSSSVSSLASSVESHQVPEPVRISAATDQTNRRSCDQRRPVTTMPESDSPLGQWPNGLSSMMACLGCTLGLFNISRFAMLSIHFGANFIFQFCILSLVFGLPLFSLQLCLGQTLGSGVIDMWKISPLFQGVGVSLLIAQALTGLYSIVGVSWMFVFFRDSFITRVDKYRWAEPFVYFRHDIHNFNTSHKISETVPDYFNGVVLQRHHLPTGNAYGTIKFQLAFNLAVVWLIVFVSLSKGLRSYGKVIYAFILLPVFGTFVLCAKILGLMPQEYINIIFPDTSWEEFFLNSKSWLAAAQETFLTWGLMGAAVMQIASHNKHKLLLQRDSSLVAVITFTILILVAFLANTCVQILRSYGYSYYPSSFERMSSSQFLRFIKDPLPPSLAGTPVRFMMHNSFILGERVVRPGVDYTTESGYQALRLATELIPATFAAVGAEQVSPFWAVLFYFIMILFGISQQLAIWHCVIAGIMEIKPKMLKAWETTIIFFSCTCGFILGLPMATELGIYIVYFMDYVMGSIWWLSIVILLQIIAVFMVRGRPYSGDTVVTALFNPGTHTCLLSWAPALLSFTWNVILPVALMVLCISTFKNGHFRDMFIWHHVPVADYWPLWVRQVGATLQLLPVLLVPLVGVIQSYRYLSSGHPDILERIQMLYRPPIGEHMETIPIPDGVNSNPNGPVTVIQEDPPPKYTPPPSYTTATGARLAKFLRQSIRRSVRRIQHIANVIGESSTATLSRHRQPSPRVEPPPPDYSTVLVEMNNTSTATSDTSITINDSPIRVSTLERLRSLESSSNAITAAEVASILRNSFRRSKIVRSPQPVQNDTFVDNSVASLSAEHLVDSAAPIGVTSLVLNVNNLSENETK